MVSLYLACVAVAALGAASLAPTAISRPFLAFCVALALGVLVLQVLYRATGPKPINWISVDILFILGYTIVHFSYALFWLVGIAPSNNAIWYASNVVCYAAAMAVCGLAAFALGFNLLPDRCQAPRRAARYNVPVLRTWKIIGTIVFLCGAATTIAWMQLARETLAKGGYVHTTELPYGARITFLLSETLLRLGLVLLTVAAAFLTRRWKIGLIPKIGLALFVGWLLVLGDRSQAAAMGLLAVAAYSEYVRRFSFKIFIITIVGGLLLMAIVRTARWAPQRNVSSFVKTARAHSDEVTWSGSVLNFGSSVQTLHAAVHTIPDRFNYFYGKLQVSSFAGIIPFSRRLLPPEQGFSSSARVLTDVINEAHETQGRGTTVVADLYCDVGFTGAVLILFGLGLLCKHVQQRARSSNSMTWAIAHAALIASMALMPRYGTSMLIRNVLWPVLATIAIRWCFRLPKDLTLADPAPPPTSPAYPSATSAPDPALPPAST